jgi:hypothetical protein
VGLAEDIGALGHEVHAAEDDEFSLGGSGGLLGELQGVAAEIGELNHFVALVVVAQDDHAVTQRLLGGRQTAVESIVGHQQVVGEIATDALFDFRCVNCLRLLWRFENLQCHGFAAITRR